MASRGRQTVPHSGQRHTPRAGHGIPMAAPGVAAPPGTFSPGTKIQVGSHRVIIQKYLSEGGFAHVYLVKLQKPVDGTDLAVLKRVAVPDKEALRSMRTEVETMKRLKGHQPIVTYIDSHASELRGGGYEVFLLMEYCNGGGLIDFMNTRLQHRLTEPEILDIFADIAEGVACMHYLRPALLHRDLKVENVLITTRGSTKRFKLCDFGSAAPPRPAPTTVVECRLMDEDVQKHTTLQYRSPEMVDVYRKQPLNEKSDIWALGVLLYKLCYYTTPFEEQGQLAILNASFRYPSYPVFSDRIKKLIASMLKESMDARPTIYQVLKEACVMQDKKVPISDIYVGRPQSEPRTNEKSLPGPRTKPQAVGAVFSPPAQQEQQHMPNVVPMRRGRPTPSSGPTESPRKRDSPPKKVTGGDPFAALDSSTVPEIDIDDLSSRFPTLDQFSLLHDQGGKFNFDSAITSPPLQPPTQNSNQRNSEMLADAATASSHASPVRTSPSRPQSAAPAMPDQVITSHPPARPSSTASPARPKPESSTVLSTARNKSDPKEIPSHVASRYVSTGTMTADIPPGQPRGQAGQGTGPRRSGSTKISSFRHPSTRLRQPSLSSRPSLEYGIGQGSMVDSTTRANTLTSRPRPASTTFESSTLEFLREKESLKAQNQTLRPSRDSPHRPTSSLNAIGNPAEELKASKSTDLLVHVDDSGSDASEVLGRSKRSSVALTSGPRLAGTLGDVVKRFEGTVSPEAQGSERPASPRKAAGRPDLTPIAGSEATDGRSDDGLIDLGDDRTTPEMRREIERRKLEQEEQRVAAAQAEYKKRVAGGGLSSRPVPGLKKVAGTPRAASIQSRVQSLLDEDQRPSPIHRTAKGYGKYTDATTAASKGEKPLPIIPRKPTAVSSHKGDTTTKQAEPLASQGAQITAAALPPTISSKPTGGKPAAPKKPVHLNSFPTGAPPPSPATRSQPPRAERLMAVDLPGQPALEMSAQERDESMKDFAKRFPSLSSMEMEAARSRGSGAVGP